jgi:hypothetical protein
MSVPLRGALACVLLGLSAGTGGAADDLSRYLTKDGKLTQKLELVDEEGGFVVTGWKWTIEPSGEWTVDPPAAGAKPRKGKLTRKELAALARHLASQDLAKLPEQFGRKARGSGFHNFVLTFGKKHSRLTLYPGEGLKDAAPARGDPNAAAWSRFTALVLVIQKWTEPPPPGR